MKRFLNLQNPALIAVSFVGLLLLTSSFTFGPVEDAKLVGDDSQKKEQRMTLVVSVDGKETKIDTVFNLPDQKMINEKVDSLLSKLDKDGFKDKKMKRIMVRATRGHKFHHPDMKNFVGDEQFDILINDDSAKVCNGRKVFCFKGGDNELMDDDGDEMAPPPPPMPPMPHGAAFMMHNGFGGDAFAFDTKDESIISYEKKDIGDGLEKITIIRKKHDEHHQGKEVKVKAIISDDVNVKKKDDELKMLKKLKDEKEASKDSKK